MSRIRVEHLTLLENPRLIQAGGKHWAFDSDGQVLKFKYDSAVSTAESIQGQWGQILDLDQAAFPSANDVIQRKCDLLDLGLVEIEFTRTAASQFVRAVNLWK
jgi:hypothetical protein